MRGYRDNFRVHAAMPAMSRRIMPGKDKREKANGKRAGLHSPPDRRVS
jgi:hypothetical protein